jgi:hypothetical protein
MTRKVAMVGNTTFYIDAAIGAQIVDVMVEQGEDVVFLTRGSEGFDRFIMQVAPLLQRRCFAYPGRGGTDNLERDTELVKDADTVLAFFDLDTIHKSDTGTAMIVEKALTAKKPTRAYTAVDGKLVWAGETQIGP